MPSLSRRSFLKTTAAAAAAGTALAALPRLAAQPAASIPNTGHNSNDVLKSDDGIERQLLRPISELNPRNSEGSGIVLKDGSILLLWTEFLDENLLPAAERPPPSPQRRGPKTDDGYARISGMISKDGGGIWSAPRVYADDADARVNTMSPAITRLQDGRLMLAYSWRSGGVYKDNYGPCARRVRFSNDEGATWSDPVRITPDDGTYHTGCHDRAWVLPSGRILVQCHTATRPVQRQRANGEVYHAKHLSVYLAYSDDAGKSWRHSNILTENRGVGCNESCLVPRADGSLLMVLRTTLGRPMFSESRDDGATWTEPRPYVVTSPDAPTYLTRIPGTTDILMVWNNNFNPAATQKLKVPAGADSPAREVGFSRMVVTRCPLLCAVSRDGGRSWGMPRALETDINYEWAYPGVVFHGDYALIHYYRSPAYVGGRELMLARVPIKQLYEDVDYVFY